MKRLWWHFLHAILPWWALRRVCDLCDEFPHDPRDKVWWEDFFNWTALNLFLFVVALFLLLVWLIPPASNCWLPPNSPTRGFYQSCWGFWEIWT